MIMSKLQKNTKKRLKNCNPTKEELVKKVRDLKLIMTSKDRKIIQLEKMVDELKTKLSIWMSKA